MPAQESLMSETLAVQHTTVKTKTKKSKVMEYGQMTFKKDSIAQYQGVSACKTCPHATRRQVRAA